MPLLNTLLGWFGVELPERRQFPDTPQLSQSQRQTLFDAEVNEQIRRQNSASDDYGRHLGRED